MQHHPQRHSPTAPAAPPLSQAPQPSASAPHYTHRRCSLSRRPRSPFRRRRCRRATPSRARPSTSTLGARPPPSPPSPVSQLHFVRGPESHCLQTLCTVLSDRSGAPPRATKSSLQPPATRRLRPAHARPLHPPAHNSKLKKVPDPTASPMRAAATSRSSTRRSRRRPAPPRRR